MKRALVTGGNKGIGLAITKRFLENGFELVIVARDFSSFNLSFPSIQAVEFDLRNYQDIPTLAKKIGHVDILINNAGIMNALPYSDYPDEKIDELLNLNLKTPVALIREFSKGMVESKYGRIVSIASIAAHTGHPDVWYGISKAGIANMTKSFAKVLATHGILVNCVAPGGVNTDMLYHNVPEERKKQILATTYLHRFGEPEEIAEIVYWLATNVPEYVNGICLDANNGSFTR